MYDRSLDPRHRRRPMPISWRAVLGGIVVSAAIPVVLWTASQPVAGVVVVALGGGLFAVATRLSTVARRFVTTDPAVGVGDAAVAGERRDGPVIYRPSSENAGDSPRKDSRGSG